MVIFYIIISSVQLLSHVQLLATPWTAAHRASLPSPTPGAYSNFKLVMPSNHLILCCPLLLLPSIFIRIFSNESVLHIRWLKYRSFSISPCNEYSGLISSRIDWSDLLVIQGTLKSLLQSHSWKASVLWCSVSLLVQKWEHNMEGPTSWRSQ